MKKKGMAVAVALLLSCSVVWALDLEDLAPDEMGAALLIAGGELDLQDWSFDPSVGWAERITLVASWRLVDISGRGLFLDVLRPWSNPGVGLSAETGDTVRVGLGGFPTEDRTVELALYLRRVW